MKRFLGSLFVGILALFVFLLTFHKPQGIKNHNSNSPSTQSVVPGTSDLTAELATPVTLSRPEQALALGTGEEHARAFAQLIDWVKQQQILTPEDRDALLAYLSQPQPPALKSGEWEERVNEILNLLRAQPGGVPGLADLMLHMAERDANPVLRMYALQHIALWIPDETIVQKREAMIQYLHQLLARPNDPLAGSALLFLTDLEHAGHIPRSAETDAQFQAAAVRLVTDPATRPDVKISVLHACVDRKQSDILPTARAIAADETQMIPLRKAAIHSIGRLGSREDLSSLEDMLHDKGELKVAIAAAIKNLRDHK